jgi:hypothetical protein
MHQRVNFGLRGKAFPHRRGEARTHLIQRRGFLCPYLESLKTGLGRGSTKMAARMCCTRVSLTKTTTDLPGFLELNSRWQFKFPDAVVDEGKQASSRIIVENGATFFLNDSKEPVIVEKHLDRRWNE